MTLGLLPQPQPALHRGCVVLMCASSSQLSCSNDFGSFASSQPAAAAPIPTLSAPPNLFGSNPVTPAVVCSTTHVLLLTNIQQSAQPLMGMSAPVAAAPTPVSSAPAMTPAAAPVPAANLMGDLLGGAPLMPTSTPVAAPVRYRLKRMLDSL